MRLESAKADKISVSESARDGPTNSESVQGQHSDVEGTSRRSLRVRVLACAKRSRILGA